MDTGSGFGGQWICDTTACDDPGGADGGRDAGPSDARVDSRTPPRDAGTCSPVTIAEPTEPGCTSAQLDQVLRIGSQADYDAFVANPANANCNNCLTQFALACGTARGCDDSAGELVCCLDDTCGEDESCRNAAFTGACASEANDLTRCISSISPCALNPLAPPAVCFP
jgi:hypothetical protein